MTTSVQSLWSDEIRPNILSPWAILLGQAGELTKLTNRTLVGELRRHKPDDKNKVVLALDILVPSLNDYRHRVLVAVHDKNMLYPVLVDADVFRTSGSKGHRATIASATASLDQASEKPANRADSDRELLKLVERVLRSPQVVSIAQSLIARANEVLIEKETRAEADSTISGEGSDELPALGEEPLADDDANSDPIPEE